jgi:ubiquinone/menaquinone biosynthesis C-methylase UbiE
MKVLDACCGSKMFWFDKSNNDVTYCDIRSEEHTLCDGRQLKVSPDVIADFTNMPFEDDYFKMVVFDPPHLEIAGKNGWMFKKYGKLSRNWKDDLRAGFSECLRVLVPGGTLIFKWNETQILTKEILKLVDIKPLFGHISGKRANTHWICFLKGE